MLFSTPEFIVGFLPVCLGGFFALGRLGGRRAALGWLLLASLFFYGWWAPRFVALLVGSVAFNFFLGRHVAWLSQAERSSADRPQAERSSADRPQAERGSADRPQAARGRARFWLTLGVTADLALLGWFKYADFLRQAVGAVIGLDQPALHLFLPLAISFFTFQQILFLLDCRARPEIAREALSYACFVAFFPHLIAGPIVRPTEILPQFSAPDMARPRHENLIEGLAIFLLGLAKKLVLADLFGRFADIGFNAAAGGASLSLFEAWYAALAYSLQIYFDFSGYSDMAIGLARMFNIRFPLNFASPYKAADISEFWRRWHISLSRFLRDTVYIPLGGNRRGLFRQRTNLMATMLLGGLWHGAAWNFVLWGGLHGACLIAHHLWRGAGLRLPRALGQAITLLAVVVAWVPFRADGFPATGKILAGMAGLNGVALPRMIVEAVPPLAWLATPVPVLPYLGDARTLSFPELTACLALGFAIALLAPHVHQLTERARAVALTGSFAFTVQALFFAPNVSPFLYFRF